MKETKPKRLMLYDPIYIKFWKRKNYKDGEQISGWRGRGGIDDQEATKGYFQGVGNVLYGTVMADTWLYSFAKTPRPTYPRVNSAVCKF